MNETHDVVVVGAGPVGLMLACELRLAGVDVLVLERLEEMDLTIKAGAINVPTAQALYRRGLLPELLEQHEASFARFAAFQQSLGAETAPAGSANTPPPGFKMVPGHFAGIQLNGAAVDLNDPAFGDTGPAAAAWFVSQQGVESILARRATEMGVEIRRGVEVTGFDDDGIGVTLNCVDRTVRAGWLVGCDGGRSIIRKVADFDFPGLDPEITGRQALVEMTGAENIAPGWHDTPNGIYVYGPVPGRFLTVELDGPPADRTTPVTAEELEQSFRTVTGADVRISKVLSATRFTDNTRQVTEYRKGRVLLAGDAAHVHSPFGGQGLNLGVGDAVNLGWKLAAVVRGWATTDLLDTYTAERHPIGAWVLDWTRAQVAVMRTDPRSRALRAVMTELLATRDGATDIFKKISGVLHRYDLGDTHPLVGAVVPDLELADGSRIGAHFATGRGVLLDLTDSPAVRSAAAAWPERLQMVTAKPVQPQSVSAMLVRPDGIVAWVADSDDTAGLADALMRWFGPAR
ncbi:FAD-dependent monooxygenase [Nocardia sp. NBC_01503]|uniref:FAD-dependent oxidoreductase n=1 Tax=Nocardia sp. NBC_01503 TaxID=2975997 RepID=UPI002E7B42B0|nr:FAD-dependent oxidoreductase [Nocardia sp. NBC_01503]WTL31354.1 FAD-dependent monooxygenase [Nocardia sp. NBC_01503]